MSQVQEQVLLPYDILSLVEQEEKQLVGFKPVEMIQAEVEADKNTALLLMGMFLWAVKFAVVL